jgi:predicted Zn finger-like uncharacterized protein
MAVEALCPTCGAVFNLSDDYVGKKVRCKKCEHAFTVGGDKGRKRDDDEGVQADRATISSQRSSRDDDEDRPTRKATARRGREDDEDSPRRSRGRDDDDDRGRSRKRKRVYHDDDDDDQDGLRRKSSGSGKIIAIIAAVAVVVLLVCGGGIFLFVRLMASAEEAMQDQMAQQGLDANGNPIFGADMGPGFPVPDVQPKDMAEALTFLKGNDKGQRRGAANWLARQGVDAARQKEVGAALEALLKDDDLTLIASARALKVWGTRDNGPALTAALKQKPDGGIPGDPQKELMAAIGKAKYDPGAEEVLRFLPNFFVGEDSARALADLGSGAEPAVLKYYHHPDGATRDRARRVLRGYNTKPLAYLDQTIADLNSVDKAREQSAVEWLAKSNSDEALQAAKADPAKQAAVAKGLNHVIDEPPSPFVIGAILDSCKRWGSKDNVAALIRLLERDPFNKQGAGDALIAIGPSCEPQVRVLLDHRDRAVVDQARRVLERIGGEDAKFVSAIADLKSDDGGRIERAARTLQGAAVDEKQRPAVVAALLGTIHDTGVPRGDHLLVNVVRAVMVWANKDDGPAIVGKVKEMHKFFCRDSRKLLIEWMGKQKVEKAIPFLAEALTDKDDSRPASQALQAMGTELGEVIEVEVAKVTTSDRTQTLECITVLGTVGTKKSLDLLKKLQALAVKQKDQGVAQACATAAAAINARGK